MNLAVNNGLKELIKVPWFPKVKTDLNLIGRKLFEVKDI